MNGEQQSGHITPEYSQDTFFPSRSPGWPVNICSDHAPLPTAASNADLFDRMSTDGNVSVAQETGVGRDKWCVELPLNIKSQGLSAFHSELIITLYFVVTTSRSSARRMLYTLNLDPSIISVNERDGVAAVDVSSVLSLALDETKLRVPEIIEDALRNPTTTVATAQSLPSIDCPVEFLLGYRHLASTLDVMMSRSSKFQLHAFPDNLNPWWKLNFALVLVMQPSLALEDSEPMLAHHLDTSSLEAAWTSDLISMQDDVLPVPDLLVAQDSRFLASMNESAAFLPYAKTFTFTLSSPKLTICPRLLTIIHGLNIHDESYALFISGGVTTSLVLPGSADVIGGQAYGIKLRKTARRSPLGDHEPPAMEAHEVNMNAAKIRVGVVPIVYLTCTRETTRR
ncbi:hypothetical protein FB446DRAFT_793561 [Lentinula raphanica]|nr:hypothetical protein FB446DRAFT_793561 [Lentinula raphanica]